MDDTAGAIGRTRGTVHQTRQLVGGMGIDYALG